MLENIEIFSASKYKRPANKLKSCIASVTCGFSDFLCLVYSMLTGKKLEVHVQTPFACLLHSISASIFYILIL